MNSKIKLAIAIIIFLLIAGGFFYYVKNKNADRPETNSAEKSSQPAAPLQREPAKKDQTMKKDGFSILQPAGWVEFGAPSANTVMIAKAKEEIIDPEAKKINFKTYYSVATSDAGGKNLDQYAKFFKDMLGSKLQGIKFTSHKTEKINNYPADISEVEASQKGINFRILMALVQGKNNSVWIVSFNALNDNWSENKDIFYKILRSFRAS